MKNCSNPDCPNKNPQSLKNFGKNPTKSDGVNNRCKACYHAAYVRTYAQKAKRDRIRAQNRAWRDANKERYTALISRWDVAHRAERAEAMRRRRAMDLEKARRQWLKEARRRRARKLDVPSDDSTPEEVLARCHSHICYICMKNIEGTFQVDHVIPISKYGPDVLANKMPTHPFCNNSKHDRMPTVRELLNISALTVAEQSSILAA